MKKNIILNINMSHKVNDEPIEKMEFSTEAEYLMDNGKTSLKYVESDLTGLDGTTTTIILDPPRVTLERGGLYQMALILEQGMQYFGAYSTPFGDVNLAIASHKVNISHTDHDLDLHMNYEMIVAGNPAGEFDMHISSKF